MRGFALHLTVQIPSRLFSGSSRSLLQPTCLTILNISLISRSNRVVRCLSVIYSISFTLRSRINGVWGVGGCGCGGGVGVGREVLISKGLEICVKYNRVWPSRHLLHRKMTKGKCEEDIKYYFFLLKISNTTVTSKRNFIEKYHCLIKDLYFIFCLLFFTSNECFNVLQLLSNLSHFVLFSQAHLKITWITKTFEKIYFIRFYWISNTKLRITLFKFFWSETWKSEN